MIRNIKPKGEDGKGGERCGTGGADFYLEKRVDILIMNMIKDESYATNVTYRP